MSCVFEADGNLNGDFTAPSSDAFLDGPGDSATIVDGGTYFGGGWTSFCSSDGGGCTTDYGFVYDAVNGDADGSTFSFTGATGSEYALGIKDGSDPAWAVFLLSSTSNSYSGTWNIFKSGTDQAADALSHFAIYDRTIPTTSTTTTPSTTTTTTPTSTPSGVAPEPTVMTLLGAGLVLAGRRFRRRNNA